MKEKILPSELRIVRTEKVDAPIQKIKARMLESH